MTTTQWLSAPLPSSIVLQLKTVSSGYPLYYSRISTVFYEIRTCRGNLSVQFKLRFEHLVQITEKGTGKSKHQPCQSTYKSTLLKRVGQNYPFTENTECPSAGSIVYQKKSPKLCTFLYCQHLIYTHAVCGFTVVQ